MEYMTLIAFGALGLAFAVFNQFALIRSRRALEAAQDKIANPVAPTVQTGRLDEGKKHLAVRSPKGFLLQKTGRFRRQKSPDLKSSTKPVTAK